MADRPRQGRDKYWRSFLVPCAVLLILVAWWSLLLPRSEKSVFARVPVLDEAYYLDQAASPAADSQPHFTSPLYPWMIAVTGSGMAAADDMIVPPEAARGIRILQIACWLGIVALLRLIAGRTLAEPARQIPGGAWLLWLPSLLFVFYRPASVYALTILLELPLVFLLVLHFYLLTWQGTRWWPALAAGLVLGTAGLLRGTALGLVPLALWVVFSASANWRQRVLHAVLFLAAVLAPLLPAALHNTRLSGRPVGPTLNGGVNLYIGNGPEANGFYVAAVPGDWLRDPAGRQFLAGRLDLPEVSLAQADSIWTAAALETMSDQPVRTLGLWTKKVWLHLQAWEIDQLTPLAGWRREVPLLGLLFLPFAALVVLGLAGLAGAVGGSPSVRVWGIGLGLLVAAQSVFFVVSRYRLALVPLLCLLATAGVITLISSLVKRKGRRVPLVMTAATAAAVLISIPWGLNEVRSHWVPLAEANEARRWGVLGEADSSNEDLARAESLYRSSVATEPENPAPWLGLAVTLVARENRAEAEDVLARAILRVERNLEIRRYLVGLLLEDGRRSDALVQAQTLLKFYPDDAETLHNATVLLAGFGNTKAALEMAGKLLAAHPENPQGAVDLGILLARSGKTKEARAVFARGLEANPGNPALLKNLEILDQTP